MNTLIISPTYNEKKNISSHIENIFSIDENYHILIIDDNSPDGTANIVKELQLKYKNLFLEERPGKAGLGTAYKHGFNWALKKNYDNIIQMDADLSHDPKEIKEMVRLLNNYDLIIGSRYIDGVSVVHWPIKRLILSYGANVYARIVTGLPIKDSTGGFKAWKRKVIDSIDINGVKSQGYSFQIEMNWRAWQKKFSIFEHPIIFADRTIGESKMSKKIMFEAIIVIWRMRIWKLFGWHK
ncbi:MAG: polyprenol monophosphomannose synthase [Candidatus Neomarinimicrobiota bacterium]|nr:polyprenol monophosphomannose synthase [Candidatus Neomarinimicrobiota bacterium]